MATTKEKLIKLAALEALAKKVKTDYAPKKEVDALKDKVTGLENAGGQVNVLEGVKVNGVALAIAEKMVDILVATGTANGTIKVNGTDVSIAGLAALAYKAQVSESDLDAALKGVLDGKAAKATTLAGYGITDTYTKTQVDGIISAVYKPAGSIAFAQLPAPAKENLGKVHNVTDAFTTDDKFLEGVGKKHPAGTNVVLVASDGSYKYDVLAGFVDLSAYVKAENMRTELDKKIDKAEGQRLMTEAEGTKLKGIQEGANKYSHPTHAAKTSGLYKVTVDNQGHVSDAAPVVKEDITKLGVPAQDTTYGNATADAAGLMSAADKKKLDGMEIATDSEVNEMLAAVFAPTV